ncbi:hypothetical protein [Streptomyces nanshensis]|uniref:Uncharacterized protein n=1 Tax=Streptomyces nanshensis TaxID=518642 RepID=A0A1E7L5C9_9ACTN|nr:hypothetical protein [Streptomyces nanshensis]OEV11407.1 hypothetical protein AN218_13060 [Streptomyces nanshensis]
MTPHVSALYADIVALMAPLPARWWMQSWLAAERFHPDTRLMAREIATDAAGDVDDAHPAVLAAGETPDRVVHSTLVTYFPTAELTRAAVTPTLLERMDDSPLWVQCGPTDTADALDLAERARRSGVAYCHAPLLASPDRGLRPRCLVYELERVRGRLHLDSPNGRDRVFSLVAALSSDPVEKGSLYFRPYGQHDLPDQERNTGSGREEET